MLPLGDEMKDRMNAGCKVRTMDKRVQSSLGRQLAAVFDDTTHAALPDDINELLAQLDDPHGPNKI
jgi:hypothetical protein